MRKAVKKLFYPQGFCDSYPQFVKMIGGQPLFIHKKAYMVAVEAVYNCIN
jgi:hypothetical protein